MLLTHESRSLADLLVLFSRYAFVDGALALLVAGGYLTVTPARMLWMSPTIDAATRAVLVGLLIVGPGITEFPLTALLYVGLIATFTSCDGVLDIIEGLALRSEFGMRGGARRASTTAMAPVAIQEALEGKVVEWLEHVTGEQYANLSRRAV